MDSCFGCFKQHFAKGQTFTYESLAVSAPKKKTSPGQFAREVRAEARKITWTSRKETWITSVMVGIMVVIAAIFFFTLDTFLGWAMGLLLQLANAG